MGNLYLKGKGLCSSFVAIQICIKYLESFCVGGLSIPPPITNLFNNLFMPMQNCVYLFWDSLVAQQLRICLQCRRHGFNPWVGNIFWRRKWQPLWCSCLENSMNRGAWRATVHGVTRVRHNLATKPPTTYLFYTSSENLILID